MSDDLCPNGHDLRGEPIPAEHRHMYDADHFSRRIGVEVSGLYDGVAYWQCPDCGTTWRRFDGPGRVNDALDEMGVA
jgi:hypothetical protein